jgi:hypothetical protein
MYSQCFHGWKIIVAALLQSYAAVYDAAEKSEKFVVSIQCQNKYETIDELIWTFFISGSEVSFKGDYSLVYKKLSCTRRNFGWLRAVQS